MPTRAKHHGIKGPPMPAGILLWGKAHSDKRLLEIGMALEVALKRAVA